MSPQHTGVPGVRPAAVKAANDCVVQDPLQRVQHVPSGKRRKKQSTTPTVHLNGLKSHSMRQTMELQELPRTSSAYWIILSMRVRSGQ